MGLHKGGEGKTRGAWGGFSQRIWEQGGAILCLLPSAHTEAKLNSNKIRHRCALLAQLSRSGHIVLKGEWPDGLSLVLPPDLLSLQHTWPGCQHSTPITTTRTSPLIGLLTLFTQVTPCYIYGSAKLQRKKTSSLNRTTAGWFLADKTIAVCSRRSIALWPFGFNSEKTVLVIISINQKFLPVHVSCFQSLNISCLSLHGLENQKQAT